MEAYTPSQLKHGTAGPPSEALLMTQEILRHELSALHFNFLQESERYINEGTAHVGLSSVVKLSATK